MAVPIVFAIVLGILFNKSLPLIGLNSEITRCFRKFGKTPLKELSKWVVKFGGLSFNNESIMHKFVHWGLA